MTDLLPSPEPELEEAIRRGFEVGLGSAPVVGDLAERVRALPQPRRHLTVLAVAASVVVVLLAVGLIVTLPSRTREAPPVKVGQSTPSPSESPPAVTPTPSDVLVGPPYPVNDRTDDKTTAARAVGAWVPVWIAGYDGPLTLAKLDRATHGPPGGPLLRVQLRDGSPGTAGGFHLSGRSGECQQLQGGLVSTTGELLTRDRLPLGGCIGPVDLLSFSMGSAFGRWDRVGVSPKGVLTLFQRGEPIAQFVHQGKAAPQWSTDGTLSASVVGQWSVLGLPTGFFVDSTQRIPLGGLTFLTLGPDGRYDGSSRCATLSGTFTVSAAGNAEFSPPTVADHRCPKGPSPTGSLADVARVAHFDTFLAFYDKGGNVLAQLQSQKPAMVVGTWERPGVRPTVTASFLSDGSLRLDFACGADRWTYSVDPDGRFSARVVPSPEKCAGPLDPGGMVTLLKAARRVDVLPTGRLALYDESGQVLASLIRLVGG